jgi:hypothetical protein
MRCLATLAVAAISVSGCAEVGAKPDGSAGVQWRVTDMTRKTESGLLTWTYTLTFTERAGHAVTFTTIRTTMMPGTNHPDAYTGGSREEPFAQNLAPNSELRIAMRQSMTMPAAMVGSSFRAALSMRLEFLGSDDTGSAVVVPVLVTFDPR